MVKYLTIPEVAKRLAVSRRTVYEYIEGSTKVHKRPFRLVADKNPNGDLRVSTTALKRFMTFCHQDGIRSGVCPTCGRIIGDR